MCIERLETWLRERQVPYEMLTRERGAAGSAAVSAPKARVSARDVAKISIVALDGRLTMVVLPATEALDLEQLKAATGAREARITNEDDHMVAFPDCQRGAIPPFGNLYDMPVFVADSLREDQQIVFAAGASCRLMRLAYRDFTRLVEPRVVPLSAVEA